MLYLVHSDFQGTPLGLWNEAGDSYYPEETTLKKSAQSLIDSRFDGETWIEFADRLGGRVSHRDWWESRTSSKPTLQEAWYELVPSDAPIL